MEHIVCLADFDSQNHKITIKGLNIPIEVDFQEDIDFTFLVRHLCELFDSKKSIILQYKEDQPYSDKEKIILETLKGIFTSFNENVISDAESSINTIDISSTDEDLPF
jgi:hypothetical protein